MTTTQTTFDGHLDEVIITVHDTQVMIDEDNVPMIKGFVDQLKDLNDELLRNLSNDDFELIRLYTIIHNAICAVRTVAKGYAKGKVDVHTAENVCASQRLILLNVQQMLRK